MSLQAQIRSGAASDAPYIAQMLGHLAQELGDGSDFASNTETIRNHGFGETPLFSTLIAETIQNKPVGFALYFPHFSTTRGKPGVYIQDLWVEPEMRGSGLGARLLCCVAERAGSEWEAAYLMLSVHEHNHDAERFYQRLGLQSVGGSRPMSLAGEGFARLRKSASCRENMIMKAEA